MAVTVPIDPGRALRQALDLTARFVMGLVGTDQEDDGVPKAWKMHLEDGAGTAAVATPMHALVAHGLMMHGRRIVEPILNSDVIWINDEASKRMGDGQRFALQAFLGERVRLRIEQELAGDEDHPEKSIAELLYGGTRVVGDDDAFIAAAVATARVLRIELGTGRRRLQGDVAAAPAASEEELLAKVLAALEGAIAQEDCDHLREQVAFVQGRLATDLRCWED